MSLITNYIPGNFFPGENFPIAGVSPTILTMRMLAWGWPDAAKDFGNTVSQEVGNVVFLVGLGYRRVGIAPGLSGDSTQSSHLAGVDSAAALMWGADWIFNFRLLSYSLDVNSSHVCLGGFGKYDRGTGGFQRIRTETTSPRAILVIERDALGVITWYLVSCNGTSVSSQAITAVQANNATNGHWISLWWKNGAALDMYVDGQFWARKSDNIPSGASNPVAFLYSVMGSPPGGTNGVMMTVAMLGLTPVIPNLSVAAP